MRYLHVMTYSKFSDDITRFYDKLYNNEEHTIVFLNPINAERRNLSGISIKTMNVCFKGSFDIPSFLKLIKLFENYDRIVLHSIFFPYLLQGLICANKRLLHSLIWIEWGFDLYSISNKSSKNWARRQVEEKIDKSIRTGCNTVVCIFPPDIDVYHQLFPESSARVVYAPYCGPDIEPEYKVYSTSSHLEKQIESGGPITVLIGHNSMPTLNHKQVLNDLMRFKDENIRLIIPLSYGDKEYGDEIESIAKNIFGEKCMCLREMVETEQYNELLKTIDIAIFNTKRQCGLGNISHLCFFNAKVYMPQDCVMYDYHLKRGVPIQNYELIKDCSFHEFIRPVKTDKPDLFQDYIKEKASISWRKERWDEVYSHG